MDLHQAWEVLGKDSQIVVASLKKFEGLEARIKATEKALEWAKKLAKDLRFQYHPDKNPGNDAAERKFKAIGIALKVIEEHTEEFKCKALKKKYQIDNPPDGFIIITKK
jgi:hypothetical protein